MQQNTRLVIITLDVVRGLGLQTAVPLHQPRNVGSDEDEDEDDGADGEDPASSEDAAGSGGRAYVPGFVLACDPGAEGAELRCPLARSHSPLSCLRGCEALHCVHGEEEEAAAGDVAAALPRFP